MDDPLEGDPPYNPCQFSGLDYDQELALPMPKPRHIRPDPIATSCLPEEDTMRSTWKKRAVTDPVVAGSPNSDLTPSEDSKKKSRLELIKSKLSFKDLRKESMKDEISDPVPVLPDVPTLSSNDDSKIRARRPLAGSGIPSASPSTYNFRAKLRPIDQSKPSPAGASMRATSQPSVPPSKIPPPPSGSLSNAQNTVTPTPVRAASRLGGGTVNQNTASTGMSSKQDQAAKTKISTPAPTKKLEPGIEDPRPSLGGLLKSGGRTPTQPNLDYPITDDSPPCADDLLEGTGKVKYVPRHWIVKHASPSAAPKPDFAVPSAYAKGETPVEALPDYMTSFKERLQKANIPLNQPVPPEIQNRSTAAHVDDIADMAQSIQRQAETGMQNLNKKFDELSTWIGDQLKNTADDITELARTNSDLVAKQFEISKEMMKFQLDVRTEIGVMERRLNIFEMKVMDEVQAELRTLARGQEDLGRKTDELYAKLVAQSDDTQKYIEDMRRKIEQIEEDVEQLKNKGVSPEILALEDKVARLQNIFGSKGPQNAVQTGDDAANQNVQPLTPVSTNVPVPAQAPERQSESSTCSTEPTIQQRANATRESEVGLLTPALPAHPSPPLPRATDITHPKSTNVFPRSVSLSKKGFLKNMKDAASTTQDPKDSEKKEKTPEKTPPPHDDNKKWNPFGFRRRRELSDSAGSNTTNSKFSWPTARRVKDTTNTPTNDVSSSRSSTPPVPPIPRLISQTADKTTTHLTPRAAGLQPKPHEGEPPSSQKLPNNPVSVQPRIHHEDSSARGSMPGSTCTPTSSFGENKLACSSVISPASFHSAQDKQVSDPTAYGSADDVAKAPLLGDTDQDWDRVSLRESSRESLE